MTEQKTRRPSVARQRRHRSRSHPPQKPPVFTAQVMVPKPDKCDTSNLLPVGYVLKNRWRVDSQLNHGAFGEVCIAFDTTTKRTVAIKSESIDAKMPLLGMESSVLRKLQPDKSAAPRFIACGHTDRVNFVVMQLLGPSILELKKQTDHDRFTFATSIRVADQMIRALRDVHEAGFLHRDVKPANFTIGPPLGNTRQVVYVLDFGLCRPYIDPATDAHYPPRPRAGFRGTPRYASIHCLANLDVGRRDDLWSIYYVLAEMMVGQLPWRRCSEKSEILGWKRSITPSNLLPKEAPSALHEFVAHLSALEYGSEPDYDTLTEMFDRALRALNVHPNAPMDWETRETEDRRQADEGSAQTEVSCVVDDKGSNGVVKDDDGNEQGGK